MVFQWTQRDCKNTLSKSNWFFDVFCSLQRVLSCAKSCAFFCDIPKKFQIFSVSSEPAVAEMIGMSWIIYHFIHEIATISRYRKLTNMGSRWVPQYEIDGPSVQRYIVDDTIHWCHHKDLAALAIFRRKWGHQFGRQRIHRNGVQPVFVIGALVVGSHRARSQIQQHQCSRMRSANYQIGFLPRVPSEEMHMLLSDYSGWFTMQDR